MSTDTNVLLDIAPGFQGAPWLLGELEAAAEITAVVEHWRHAWRPQTWVERPSSEIVGPGGFAILLDDTVAQVYHVMKWGQFCGRAELRDPLRLALHVLARCLGSSRMIYHHEGLPSGFHDGIGLDAIEKKLRGEFGAPAATFEQLRAADLWSAGCWYIEDCRS